MVSQKEVLAVVSVGESLTKSEIGARLGLNKEESTRQLSIPLNRLRKWGQFSIDKREGTAILVYPRLW